MKLASILAAVLFVALLISTVWLPGCALFDKGKSLANIEAMAQEDFDSVELHADLLVRVVVGRLFDEGKVSAETLETAAAALDSLANDPFSLSGSTLISAALKQAGLTDTEALLAIVLVEDFLRSKFSWGNSTDLLGTRARHLLSTVATAIRSGTLQLVTDEEKAKAAKLLEAK